MAAITLYDYQRAYLSDRARFKIAMLARQTGKTFTTTLELVDDCLDAEAAGQRKHWVILSRGERQAREAMEHVKRHLKAYAMVFDASGYDWRGDSRETYKALEVVLPKGSRITALPANPDTARGFSANVFLDEFAFHQDSRKIWQALFPVISAGFKLRVVSTPNGKNNKFYELMTSADPIWSRHSTDIHRAVHDGLLRDVDELRRGLADEDAWAQEFEIRWLDEASAWLSFDLITSVEHDEAGEPSRYCGGPCFIGNDIAARHDLWVAWVVEQIGDVLWTREIRVLKRATFAEQDSSMDELFSRYQVSRLAMDQTGLGEKPVEDAKRRYGEHVVEGVIFTSPNKLLLANTGKMVFEDRRIRIPLGDAVLRADLHKLRKTTSATGAPRFIAESDADGHADRAWACFLAAHAASIPAMQIDFDALEIPRAALAMSRADSPTRSSCSRRKTLCSLFD
jgi:phage FluMu gp28-like protein